MALDIVDRVISQINFSGGNVELDTIASVTVNETDEKSPVETMNRRREAIGYTRGVKKYDADIEKAIPEGDLDVDFRRLMIRGEEFTFTYQEGDNGKRYQLVDCVVDSVSTPYSKDGEVRQSIKLKALSHREAP